MAINVRAAESSADFEATIEITLRAWQTDLGDAMPAHALRAIADNKGIVLLAVDGDRPIGFCYSIVSFEGDSPTAPDVRFKHYSHQAGVLPAYQGRGVGEMLKWAQRRAVLQQGISHITWTFDPLQTLNARLNIHKLGAVCGRYIRNRYGKLDDALNAGLPTDRFEVDWWIASDWVAAHRQENSGFPLSKQGQPVQITQINSVTERDGWLRPDIAIFDTWLPQLRLTVPRNFVQMRQNDLSLALAWRYHTRELFEAAFARGYTAVDLIAESDRCHYRFAKDWSPDLPSQY